MLHGWMRDSCDLVGHLLRPVIQCSSVLPMHLGKRLVGVLALLVWAANAHATPCDPDKPKCQANALKAEAKSAYEGGRYRQAARAFLRAYDILNADGRSHPGFLYNAGRAFEELSDCDLAADLYIRYLPDAPDSAVPGLKARIATVERCAPKAAINSSPPGAHVLIAGKDRGLTPLTLHLKPGNYTLAIEKPGYQTFGRAIAHRQGSPFILNAQLKTTRAEGQLALHITYSAEIFLDNEPLATGPYQGFRNIPVGQHQLRIEVPGCEPQTLTIDLSEGHETKVAPLRQCVAKPQDPPKLVLSTPAPQEPVAGPSPRVWTSGGAGLAALLAGGTFSVLHRRAAALRDRLDADRDQTASEPIRAADNAAGRWGIAAGLSFGAAVVGLGAAVILWVTDEGGQPTAFSATTDGLSVRF